ncbi:MAG: hypothetical protein ACK4RK_11615 [Gemmataceae bacterium]
MNRETPLLPHRLELRDTATGAAVGYVIPKQEYDDALSEKERRELELEQEVQHLKTMMRQLVDERDQLRQQVRHLETTLEQTRRLEVEPYLKALYVLTKDPNVSFSEDELRQIESAKRRVIIP